MAKRRIAILLSFGLVTACSGGGGPEPPKMAACGTAGAKTGNACSGLPDCGGAPNFQKVSFCEHCFAYEGGSVCEAGTCRDVEADGTTNLKLTFEIPAKAAGARSFTAAALNPIMADGTQLTCAGLMSSSCTFVDDPAFNARNSHFRPFAGGGADPTLQYMDLILVEAGADRIAFVQLTQDAQGKGDVKATGCAEHIRAEKGQTTTVLVTLE